MISDDPIDVGEEALVRRHDRDLSQVGCGRELTPNFPLAQVDAVSAVVLLSKNVDQQSVAAAKIDETLKLFDAVLVSLLAPQHNQVAGDSDVLINEFLRVGRLAPAFLKLLPVLLL